MYFLLTGKPPFTADTPIKVMIAHAQEVVRPPRMINSDIPLDVERIILRCLAKDPEDRFQTVAELQRELAACECADAWTQELARQWWTSRSQLEDTDESAAAEETSPEDAETGTTTACTAGVVLLRKPRFFRGWLGWQLDLR